MNDALPDQVRIGDELVVEFHARRHEDGMDFLDAVVTIQARAFSGSFACDFEVKDLGAFARQLADVGSGSSPSAELATFDGYLQMVVRTRDARGGKGVADWENSATFPAGVGPSLEWEMTQTLEDVAEIARHLADICEVRGR